MMIFTLIDYLSYVRRVGRYGDNQKDGGMAMAHLGRLPAEVVAALWPGDMIFTQRLDSKISWAMMYLTSSPVDHVAMYAGDGKIAHVTLAGFKVHRIDVFGKHTRLLPVRLAPSEKKVTRDDGKFHEFVDKYARQPPFEKKPLPARVQLSIIAVKIILGFYSDRFSWKFIADLVVVAVATSVIFWLIGWSDASIGILGIAISLLLLTAVNRLRALINRIRKVVEKPFSHPEIGYHFFFRWGGLMFSKIGPLVICPFGILPLKAFRALGRKSAEDRSEDQLNTVSKNADNFLESWNAPYALYDPEDHEGNQDNQKEI